MTRVIYGRGKLMDLTDGKSLIIASPGGRLDCTTGIIRDEYDLTPFVCSGVLLGE